MSGGSDARNPQPVTAVPGAPSARLRRDWNLARGLRRRVAARGLGAGVGSVPSMLSVRELQLLHHLGARHFQNHGSIIDAGCFLGGSTLALARGVEANEWWRMRPRRPVIHAYDLFRVEEWTVGVYFTPDTAPGADTEPLFRRFIEPVAELVAVHAGNVLGERWDGSPVEVLFIDLAKHWTVSDHVVRTFFPALIPRHSVVVQQDYLYHQWNGWLPVTMEYFADYFELVEHCDSGSVAFRYVRRIPERLFDRDVFASLGRGEIGALFDRAIARFDASQRRLLEASRRQLMSVLEEAGWDD